jgi:hypothetical protein
VVGFRREASGEVHQIRQAVVVAEVRPAEDLLQVAVAVCRAGRS